MRTWTLAEAQEALPVVRSLLEEGREILRQLQVTEPQGESDAFHGRGSDSQAIKGRRRLESVQATRQDLVDRLADLGMRVEAVGFEVKDYLAGLVDFRARLAGRDVYLCWRMGEERIGHWHPLDGGFAGRRQIPSMDEVTP
jgi:hypothetical protein